MKIRIKKMDLVDYSLLILMYLQLVILEFFGFSQSLNKIVTVLILIRILFMRGKQWRPGLICGAGLGIIFILGLILGTTFNSAEARSNFLLQLYPILYTYYVVFMCRNRPEIIDTCLRKGFWVFNVTMVANIVVLLMQILVPYSIIAVADETRYITFYEDNISGLFQYASTHVVCLFTIFILLYDISFGKLIKKKLKIMEKILVAVMLVVSLFIAANSDNKAFFLLLPLALFAYWYAGNMHFVKRFIWIAATIILIPGVVYGIYLSNDFVREFVDTNILKTIDIILVARNLGASANGSNERIAIISDALNMGSTWFLGKGFGSTSIYGSGYLGYNHFGQADFGSILVLGGVWYLVLLFVFYVKSFIIVINPVAPRRAKTIRIAIIAFLLCVSVYTQCFTRTNSIIALLLIMFAFRVRQSEDTRIGSRKEVPVRE